MAALEEINDESVHLVRCETNSCLVDCHILQQVRHQSLESTITCHRGPCVTLTAAVTQNVIQPQWVFPSFSAIILFLVCVHDIPQITIHYDCFTLLAFQFSETNCSWQTLHTSLQFRICDRCQWSRSERNLNARHAPNDSNSFCKVCLFASDGQQTFVLLIVVDVTNSQTHSQLWSCLSRLAMLTKRSSFSHRKSTSFNRSFMGVLLMKDQNVVQLEKPEKKIWKQKTIKRWWCWWWPVVLSNDTSTQFTEICCYSFLHHRQW